MKVGIIGGGMLGLSLAYFLGRQGIQTTVFEAKPKPGGLLDYFDVDGAWIDKYYHCILSRDTDLLDLVAELGLQDRVRFTATKQGVYYRGRLYPMGSGKDFLLFPPLSLLERFRLGLTVLGAFRINDWRSLEDVSVEDWLVGLGGRGTFDKLWKPLLRAKFDDSYAQTPATYIWSRLKRTSSPGAAAGQPDRMGYFVGSYKVLVERLVERLSEMGCTVRTDTRVERVHFEHGRARGVVVDGRIEALDAVVGTAPLPVLRRLLPPAVGDRMDWPESVEFLGVVCGLLLLDRGLSPYYALNLADEDAAFTGVIETTNLIAPEHVGGYHLVYLPKYVLPGSAYAQRSDAELRELYAEQLARLFPGFRRDWIKHCFVFRERYVEPLHRIGTRRPVVPVSTAVPGLYVVNNGQIYPELTNCQASVQHARRVLPALLADIAVPAAAAPALAFAAAG